jgi:hypothetical protein
MRHAGAFVLLFLSLVSLHGQQRDSVDHKTPASWKKFEIAPRIGIGVQRSFFFEAGFSLQRNIYEARHGFITYNWYLSYELNPPHKGEEKIYGPKLGFESVFNGGAGAIEVKYLTNGEKDDVMITPKYGFGIGFVNLFYGYNFSTNKYPFPKIRKHQFTFIINTNLIFYAGKYEKK